MRRAREAIAGGTFPSFVREFFQRRCRPSSTPEGDCEGGNHSVEYEFDEPPKWCVDALKSVDIEV